MFGRDYNHIQESEDSEQCDDELMGSVDLIAKGKATVARTRRALAASQGAAGPVKK